MDLNQLQIRGDLMLNINLGVLIKYCYQFYSIEFLKIRKQLNKYNLTKKQFQSSSQAMTSKQSAITLSSDEIMRMKMKANLVPNYNQSNDRAQNMYQQSLLRTEKWSDNPKDLKTRKEEERFRKFQKQQLERRRIDEEERKYQQKVKKQELQRANQKMFMNSQKVRALNSKLLMSDTLAGREEQLEIKNYLQDIQKKREQYYLEETLEQVKKQQQQEKRKNDQERKKLKDFEKGIRKQHKEVKKKYIQEMREELEDGELVKLKAEAAIRQEQEKERLRRDKKVQNMREANQINNKNLQLKATELQKQKQEQARIQSFRNQKDAINDLTKKRQQEIIERQIKQRQQLYKTQAEKIFSMKNNEQQRLERQRQQLHNKENQTQKQKDQQRKLLKEQYEQSLRDQVDKKTNMKKQQVEDTQKFKETWQSKLSELHGKEKEEEEIRKQIIKKNQQDLKKQMDERQNKREAEVRKELEQSEKVKANIQNEDKQFNSYAQKCLKEWEGNGKNLYPIIKHLTQTMKN